MQSCSSYKLSLVIDAGFINAKSLNRKRDVKWMRISFIMQNKLLKLSWIRKSSGSLFLIFLRNCRICKLDVRIFENMEMWNRTKEYYQSYIYSVFIYLINFTNKNNREIYLQLWFNNFHTTVYWIHIEWIKRTKNNKNSNIFIKKNSRYYRFVCIDR